MNHAKKSNVSQLSQHRQFQSPEGPLVLVIMDGVGIGKKDATNAVYKANTPFLDSLVNANVYTTLKAHGTAVGMPNDDDMGNSEVGHNTLGAGRVFDQGAKRVQHAIESGLLFKGPNWKTATHAVNTHQSTLHFIGLLSDGNVHSHITHLIKMIDMANKDKVERIRLHILLDGRDVGERTALRYIKQIEAHIASYNQKGRDYKIASGGGRMITTMDRYNADWRIVKRGWDAHVLGKAPGFDTAAAAIAHAYDSDPNLIDQYIPPFTIKENGIPVGSIVDHDSVILFNFRGDRAIEITQAFESEVFTHFDRERRPDIFFVGMLQYDGDLKLPKHYLVEPPQIETPLGHYLCASNLKSFAISETQKYGHVTYFWNGNNSGYINSELETYIEIPSDTIPFDQAPKMKAQQITEKTIKLIESGHYHFGRINFPNGDMVGHTGVFDAVVASIEETDRCVKAIVETVNKHNGITIILADHGNADEMFTIDTSGKKHSKTSHSLNPVPFAIIDSQFDGQYQFNPDISTPGLSHVAATICNLLGYQAPQDYDLSLIIP
jgi:2,3-bisphosphoglycerate-independent phosphoglycerate mutase